MNTDTYPKSQQQLRSMALHAQLLAVDAQAAALRDMDHEHTFGMESTFDIDRLRERVHTFVKHISSFVADCEELSKEDARARLAALADKAAVIKSDADQVNKNGALHAKFRYSPTAKAAVSPEAFAEPGKSTGDDNKSTSIPTEVNQLQARADFACVRAELDEYFAFTLQVHALCNMALEFGYCAMVKRSKFSL